MYTLNFPNGNSQTYPDHYTMERAAQAMGGDAEHISGDIYVFVPDE